MESVRYLVVGAGVSGLAFANFIKSEDCLILEADSEIGGYCKTIKQDGFVWDYSGHFFHFRDPEVEAYLAARMPQDEVSTVQKVSQIYYKGAMVDFPFQKNIHQLPQEEFLECLHDLFFRDETEARNFQEMLYTRFGRGIAEKFLIPYNEKLYACDLASLDVHAMGRFFPHADLKSIISNFTRPDNHSYNATFTYPKGGAIRYIEALTQDLPEGAISLREGLVGLDLDRKVATTSKGREIAFEYLISSAPFDKLLHMTGLEYDPSVFTSNKVAVFNLGFDRKGPEDIHWVYFPERRFNFYRVGFYDNILDGDRMSLYIEVGKQTGEEVDKDALLSEVLQGLEAAGISDGHELVSHHHIVLDPAYVHITEASRAAFARFGNLLRARGVYSVGRYGGWTYCSIEDNILETRELARLFNQIHHEPA